MSFSALVNVPITINLIAQAQATGWSFDADGVSADHDSCISGNIVLTAYPVTGGKSYKISWICTAISSGNVQAQSPGSNGTARTTTGLYVETLTPTSNGFISFYSNGTCTITGFNIQPVSVNPGITIVYSAMNKKWSDFRTLYPDYGWSLFTRTIFANQGALWVSDNGGMTGVANNFFGTQFQSVLQFVENKAAESLKSYNSLALQANEVLITTPSGITTSLGQVSELIEADFIKSVLNDGVTTANIEAVEGIYSASFLRDLQSNGGLINGDGLRGNYIIITLTTVTGSTFLKLFSVAVNASQLKIGTR